MNQEENSVSPSPDISARDTVFSSGSNGGDINLYDDQPQKRRLDKRVIIILILVGIIAIVGAIVAISDLMAKKASALYREFGNLLIYGPEGQGDHPVDKQTASSNAYVIYQADKDYVISLKNTWDAFYKKAKEEKALGTREKYYESVDAGMNVLAIYYSEEIASTDDFAKIYYTEGSDAMVAKINSYGDKYAALNESEYSPDYVFNYSELAKNYRALFDEYLTMNCFDKKGNITDDCYSPESTTANSLRLAVQNTMQNISTLVQSTSDQIVRNYREIREQDIIDAEN